jgi:predicted transposase/invertase (TIGR01784 family)
MPKFIKAEAELENELEEWLYILNNLKKFTEIPVSLRGNDKYEKIFEIAAVGNLTPEEMNEYQQSLKIQRDNYSVEKAAKNEGLEIGREERNREIARNLKNNGITPEIIAKSTGLSIEEIEAL